MKPVRSVNDLTKGDLFCLGLLISYFEASLMLNCTTQNICKLVKQGKLERVLYKKRQYISLMSILQYTKDLKTGDVVVLMYRVEFKPFDNEEFSRNKEIKMLSKESWNDVCEGMDNQLIISK